MTLRSQLQPLITGARRTRNRICNLADPPVLVLIYHRVATLDSDPQLLAVTPENFRAQMQYLKEHHPVLRFEDDWSRTREPAVVVTFDDGYADNALQALPVLEELGVPATFFISTGTIGTRCEFWWDELERLLLGEGTFPQRFTLQGHPEKSWPTASASERMALYRELQPYLKRLESKEREASLSQLRDWAQVTAEGREEWRPMTHEELRRLSRSSLVTIGAHTVTHTALSAQPVEAQRREIVQSKAELESWLGREIAVFSYPFGSAADFNSSSCSICREAGFTKVAANFPGQAHRWTDRYRVPRQLVRDWPVRLFAEKLQGYWTL